MSEKEKRRTDIPQEVRVLMPLPMSYEALHHYAVSLQAEIDR
jgi:hypothetical protein